MEKNFGNVDKVKKEEKNRKYFFGAILPENKNFETSSTR